ncbi:DUF1289 domain-containing protein [Gayadomonas joobiniege]|uniref:DUF1289 domain-containing protein n=1 Tax=Gayadomonas joobiniege TaxID=1234606 RepID=UPI000378C1A3|nr:DUF1289 domain-containing protein [Gayadomonas joobiniege]
MSDFPKNRVLNPCIGYCLFNDDSICAGCGRSRDERADWIFMSESEKQATVIKAKERLPKKNK